MQYLWRQQYIVIFGPFNLFSANILKARVCQKAVTVCVMCRHTESARETDAMLKPLTRSVTLQSEPRTARPSILRQIAQSCIALAFVHNDIYWKVDVFNLIAVMTMRKEFVTKMYRFWCAFRGRCLFLDFVHTCTFIRSVFNSDRLIKIGRRWRFNG